MRRGGTRANAIDVAAWAFVAFVGVVTLTQAFGWAGTRIVAVVQSLTPYLWAALVPVVLVALWRRRLVLVTTATAIGVGLAILAAPLAFPGPPEPPSEGSTVVRVASVNLWFENERIGDVDEALADVDADVIVFHEYTPSHQASLRASDLSDRYEHRIDRGGLGATGIAVWSRWPMRIGAPIDTFNDSLDITIDGPDGAFRIVGMHMPTPIVDFDAWRRDLGVAAQVGRTTEQPTLLIGDLNASYWHPDFRRLLDAGFVDANTATGVGFSTSWPTNWIVPPFVRLDHALTARGLVSTDVADFTVPGSDHLGLVVTVAPARRAAP